MPENWGEYLKRMAAAKGGGCGIMGCEGDNSCIFQATASHMLHYPGSLPADEILLRLKRNIHGTKCTVPGMKELGDEMLAAISKKSDL